jgi:YfiH family protein
MNHKDIKIIYTERVNGNMNLPENREKFLEQNNLSHLNPIVVKQVHSNNVIDVDKNYSEKIEADGMITNDKDLILISRMSDCVPLLFFDPIKKVIAAVHAGREGTFKKIAQKTVEKFVNEFDSDPENILVEIGPSIGGCCYEVDQSMVGFVRENFGPEFLTGGENNRNIDLKGINKKVLIESGIKEENINDLCICTKCGDHQYFSYRKKPEEGNFASMIYLK